MKPLIFCIEDDEVTSCIMVHALVSSGFRALAAASAPEGWKMIRQVQPNLIITDLRLPWIDGAVAATLMRRDASLRKIPLILTSSQPVEDLRKIQEHMKADDILPKPFHPSDLVALVRRWTEEKSPVTLNGVPYQA